MSIKSEGMISQVIGPVIDVSFEQGQTLPNIFDALEVVRPDGQVVVLETQQEIGRASCRERV